MSLIYSGSHPHFGTMPTVDLSTSSPSPSRQISYHITSRKIGATFHSDRACAYMDSLRV